VLFLIMTDHNLPLQEPAEERKRRANRLRQAKSRSILVPTC
jgi:hypothetical protein